MKKVLLTLAFALTFGYASAQRTIDWSVDQIVKPTQLNSNVSTGTPLAVEAVLKSNGTDTAFVGDTMLYQIVLLNASNQVILAIPNGSLYFSVLKKDYATNDTMHLNFSANINSYVTTSQNIQVQVRSFVINRAAGLDFEAAGTSTNNVKTNAIVWYNPQGWGVNVADIRNNTGNIIVYPNPTAGDINVTLKYRGLDNNVGVKLYDLTGKVVLSQNAPVQFDQVNINTSALTNGIYTLEITSGDIISKEKVVVTK